MTSFWEQLHATLTSGHKAVLLYVAESSGSSPGRQGFKMAVTDNGEMFGTVGGGIMEQKLVQLAQSKLAKGPFPPFKKRQIHSPDVDKSRSGMICSGEQTLVFYHLDQSHIPLFERVTKDATLALQLDQNRLMLQPGDPLAPQFKLEHATDTEWIFLEQLQVVNTAYIFGGGHVGLAMSRVMSDIGFRVVVFDNREHLNTLENNRFADEKHIIDYRDAGQYVPESDRSYVILMSFGYKTDNVIIRQLLGKRFKYIGMMGSQAKIETLWKELSRDGFPSEQLERVHAPIGIPIHSKTTDEIAVSIAAEIISVKNRPDG